VCGSGGTSRVLSFLTSALDESEWLVSHPGRFTPDERALASLSIGGWVSLKTGLEWEKCLAHSENWTPAVQPVARRYADWAILAPWTYRIRNINRKQQVKVSRHSLYTFQPFRFFFFLKSKCAYKKGLSNDHPAFYTIAKSYKHLILSQRSHRDFLNIPQLSRYSDWLRAGRAGGREFESR
jgi:hypothetical protein